MNLPLKVSEREKRFLLIGGIAVLLIIFFHIFSVYSDYKNQVEIYTDKRILLLEQQLRKLAAKENLQEKASEIEREIERYERFFLRGNKPPVAAAELQKTLKDISSSLKIDIRMERALNPIDSEFYIHVPVEIGFTASTNGLRLLLEKIKQTPFMLTISELKVRVLNIRDPEDINVTLVVTGFIRKANTIEAVDKEVKNVT